MNRRDFLRTIGLATTSTIIIPPLIIPIKKYWDFGAAWENHDLRKIKFEHLLPGFFRSEGDLFFNKNIGSLMFFNGTLWKPVSSKDVRFIRNKVVNIMKNIDGDFNLRNIDEVWVNTFKPNKTTKIFDIELCVSREIATDQKYFSKIKLDSS